MMQRRSFLQALAATGLLPHFGVAEPRVTATEELMRIWTDENDRSVSLALETQNRETQSRFFGGFPNRHRIYFIGSTAHTAKNMVAAYIDKRSTHYEAENVAEAINRATTFVLNAQHSDGTIDLVSTNFHSPPDTAFAVEPVAMALSTINRMKPDSLPTFQRGAKEFLQAAGDALTVGGIHTPNHRWVVCSALARIHSLFASSKYIKRIDQWLSEGIDIDADGQYTEQSVAGYSPLVNRCLITMSRLLDRKELLEPVRKNLELTKYFLHGNGELVTDASKRQDQFRIASPRRYYYSYRYMALADRDSGFAGMVKLIEDVAGIPTLSGELSSFLEDPHLWKGLPPVEAPPRNYKKYFLHSGIVRIRKESIDASILAGNSSFFTFFKGDAALQAVRFASAFFGKGQFESKSIKLTDDSYVLNQELSGPYYQPLDADKISGDGDWEKLPRAQRQQSEVMTLKSQVIVREDDGRFRLTFDIRGTAGVPVAVELAFRKGGALSGVRQVGPERYLLQGVEGMYELDGNKIYFGPGQESHAWTDLRGAKPKLDAMSVYITGYTPFQWQLTIR